MPWFCWTCKIFLHSEYLDVFAMNHMIPIALKTILSVAGLQNFPVQRHRWSLFADITGQFILHLQNVPHWLTRWLLPNLIVYLVAMSMVHCYEEGCLILHCHSWPSRYKNTDHLRRSTPPTRIIQDYTVIWKLDPYNLSSLYQLGMFDDISGLSYIVRKHVYLDESNLYKTVTEKNGERTYWIMVFTPSRCTLTLTGCSPSSKGSCLGNPRAAAKRSLVCSPRCIRCSSNSTPTRTSDQISVIFSPLARTTTRLRRQCWYLLCTSWGQMESSSKWIEKVHRQPCPTARPNVPQTHRERDPATNKTIQELKDWKTTSWLHQH